MIFTIKSLIILIFVISILYISIKLVQKYSKVLFSTKLGKNKHVKIDSVFYLDDTNKLITLKYKSTIYIILISKTNNILLDKYEITQELH